MRITALVKSQDHVCTRYRIEAFRPALEQAGHELTVRAWSHPWLLRQVLPFLRDKMDALIVQRRLFPNWQLNLLRQRVRWLIYDFDDAIFLHSSYFAGGIDSPKRQHRFNAIVARADLVTAGNAFLQKHATASTEPAKVSLIPTCVDVARYSSAAHDARATVKLAWIGSASTLRGLVKIRDHLEHLGSSVSDVVLKVICDKPLQLDKLPVEFRPWSDATECAELADADIGISWIPDDWWSEGKCGLKVLQYMAAGLPVIANPVGMHKTLVRHGETGFLAETSAEWERAVQTLARDANLRRKMGRAGRQLVEAEYDVRVGAAAWLKVLNKLEARTLPRAMTA